VAGFILQIPESPFWRNGWRLADRFAVFVKLIHGTHEETKQSRHNGPVAFGERFQQLKSS